MNQRSLTVVLSLTINSGVTATFAAGSTVDFTGATVSGLPAAPVTSVFTRTGAVVAASGDYAAFYQPLDSDLTSIAALTTRFWQGLLDSGERRRGADIHRRRYVEL